MLFFDSLFSNFSQKNIFSHFSRHLILGVGLLVGMNMPAYAELEVEVTGGTVVNTGKPIAVAKFNQGVGLTVDTAAVIRSDLMQSRKFAVLDETQSPQAVWQPDQLNATAWQNVGREYVVMGNSQFMPSGQIQYQAHIARIENNNAQVLDSFAFETTPNNQRGAAHEIANRVYQVIFGKRAIFHTKIAYVAVEDTAPNRYFKLMLADADGQNARTLIKSAEPIMSPNWSPAAQEISFLAFAGNRPGIYVYDVRTQNLKLLVRMSGLNSAPTWSPDGKQMAFTLSVDGNPEIFSLDLRNEQMARLTNDGAVDAEPTWSPDGGNLAFTSDRSGSPQIYLMKTSENNAKRITFEGKNTHARFSPDGTKIVMVNESGGRYRIALYDLNTRSLRMLSNGNSDDNPSFAPDGESVIYATEKDGKEYLATVSLDGTGTQRLRQESAIRDPSWSPLP